MRYARYGKVCVAVKKDADEKGEQADEEAVDVFDRCILAGG